MREVPREEEHDDRDRGDPCDRELIRKAHRRGEYASRDGLSEDPRCQSRRDRDPRVPHAPRARDRDGRRLLRGRSRPAPRRRCGRGVPARAGAGERVVPSCREDRRGRRSGGGGRDPPRLRVSGGERRVRAPGRGGGHRVDRPATRGDRGDGVEDRGARAHARSRRAGRARHHDTCYLRRGRARRCGRRRLPDRRQGVGGGRWERDARRSLRRRGRACLRERPARGRGVLRRPGGLRRALPRGSAARRGPGPRRLPRQRRSPRRARLHDPAAASEARRGDAVARRGRRAPRPHRDDRDRRRSCGRLSIRGNDRGPARRRRCVLLPRDEHARAGRAHRHGGRDRDRHRARADPYRCRASRCL